MDFLKYLKNLNPAEFDKYTPPKGVALTASQARKLQYLTRQLPIDRNMLLYFWRFVFGIDIKAIRLYADIENANGVIESLRFACKRYLGLDKPISNAGMARVFEPIMDDYEIVLVSAEKGICWYSGKTLDSTLVKAALEERGFIR